MAMTQSSKASKIRSKRIPSVKRLESVRSLAVNIYVAKSK